MPIILSGSIQLEDSDASIYELREQHQYLKQLEQKEKITQEAIMWKTRFQGSMKFDEGSDAAGMGAFFLSKIQMEVYVCS